MKKLHLLLILCFTVPVFAFAQLREYQLDRGTSTNKWGMSLGNEFPGAKGKLTIDSGKLLINYDFSGGGKYIAVWSKIKLPEHVKEIFLEVVPAQDSRINYRIMDATGRVFQGRSQVIKKSAVAFKLSFKTTGSWESSWGGKKSSQPRQPFKQFFFMVSPQKDLPETGTIKLESFGITSDVEIPASFSGTDAKLEACNWLVSAEWVPSLEGALLKVTANKKALDPITFSIDFPRAGRDDVFRRKLIDNETFFYSPPLTDGGNVYNRYNLIMKLSDDKGNQAQALLTLSGNKSASVNFGAPTASKDIKSSRIGVCTHFSYGRMSHWKPWAPYKELIDGIAECGYKWVRDGYYMDKLDDGSFKVKEWDINWMKYARSKGLDIILVIALRPERSLEEYAKYIEGTLKDTEGLVNVFELGNEPHNFHWKKKFGGSWNGYDHKTGEIDQWVTEHLKMTNFIADHIKKLRPDATVIGLGACSPTNQLVLEKLEVSNNIDGIADHPYTYSMPPERIPFAKDHLKRDGIIVADGSYDSLIESYTNVFKKSGKMRSLWITEFGFSSFWFNGSNENNLYAGFTEAAQAVYVIRRYLTDLAHPIIAATCVYDYLDDYGSKEYNPEANFGTIRADHSRKPVYYAVQRLNSLFNGYNHDTTVRTEVVSQPLHRSCVQGVLVKDWDKSSFSNSNDIMTAAFSNPDKSNIKMLAIWSAQAYSRQFNNRVCSLKIPGMGEYKNAVAIDVITGRSYDVNIKVESNDLLIENLSIKGNPLVIKLIK
jgi:hypothetical protein